MRHRYGVGDSQMVDMVLKNACWKKLGDLKGKQPSTFFAKTQMQRVQSVAQMVAVLFHWGLEVCILNAATKTILSTLIMTQKMCFVLLQSLAVLPLELTKVLRLYL